MSDIKPEGKKYDNGKLRLGEMILDFSKPLSLICEVWMLGAEKYAKSNWRYVNNAFDRYTNAMIRHFILEETEVYDKETEFHHAVHVAWNAIARLFFITFATAKEHNEYMKDIEEGACSEAPNQ